MTISSPKMYRFVIKLEFGDNLNISKSTIDLIRRKNLICCPHELKEIHLTNRINACVMHLKRFEFDPFFKQIITGNEKWIVCDNVSRK